MKRWKMAIVVLSVLPLTGCIQRYEVPEDKSDAVAEYMAGALLQSDISYKDKLITEDELGIDTSDDENTTGDLELTPTVAPTIVPTVVPTPGGSGGEGGNHGSGSNPDGNSQKYNLSQVIGTDKFNLSYLSKEITENYPEKLENIEFPREPREGNELLVITFKIENLLKTDEKFNLIKNNIEYQLIDDEGAIYNPLFTLLQNDMRFIDITVLGGKSKAGILLFEIPKNKMLQKSKLTVSNGDKTVTIELK